MSGVVFERVVRESGAATALRSLDPKIEEGEFLTLLDPCEVARSKTG